MNESKSTRVTADEAARWLGISRASLYAYVSRGLIRSEAVPGSKARRYNRADVEALATRGRGAGPRVSASALRFGEPLLESHLTLIQNGRLFYRGLDAIDLARSQPFEAVADLLWSGSLGTGPWTSLTGLAPRSAVLRRLVRSNAGGSPIERAMAGVMAVGILDADRFSSMKEQVSRSAGTLVRTVIALMARDDRLDATLTASSCAEALWFAIAARSGRPSPAEHAALNAALILCADHELNASAFTARVAASTGATLYAVVTAALATLSGPRHGSASDRVEALLRELSRETKGPGAAHSAFSARLARGENVHGFDHPLYPNGDPRYVALRELCDSVRLTDTRRAVLARLDAAADAARRLGLGEPTLDVGLVSLRVALGLPVGAATAIFAAGRTAGWIAHAHEQSGSDQLLRPRARYVGPPPALQA